MYTLQLVDHQTFGQEVAMLWYFVSVFSSWIWEAQCPPSDYIIAINKLYYAQRTKSERAKPYVFGLVSVDCETPRQFGFRMTSRLLLHLIFLKCYTHLTLIVLQSPIDFEVKGQGHCWQL